MARVLTSLVIAVLAAAVIGLAGACAYLSGTLAPAAAAPDPAVAAVLDDYLRGRTAAAVKADRLVSLAPLVAGGAAAELAAAAASPVPQPGLAWVSGEPPLVLLRSGDTAVVTERFTISTDGVRHDLVAMARVRLTDGRWRITDLWRADAGSGVPGGAD